MGMRLALTFAFLLAALSGIAQTPLFRIDGITRNKTTGKPEAGVKVEIIQSGASLFQTVSASTGRYDLKGSVDFKKPYQVVYSKPGFVSKTLSFDYSKMNLEDAPPGDIRPVGNAEFDMIPTDPNVDLSFLNTEPVGKFYWDEMRLEPAFDKIHQERISNKINKIISDAAKNNAADEAKYNALIAEADGLFNQQKWEEARAKYEESLAIKPMEKHPNQRIMQCDELIMAKKKEELTNQQATSEYDNLIAAADALRDQKKYEQAILKYEEALRKKDEQYPKDQLASLKKLVEDDKKYKELVSQADMFYNQRSWLAAKDKYTQANKLKPAEQHPITRLTDIDKKLTEQNAANEKKKKYEDALAAADELFKAEKYEEAKVKYQEALTYESSATYPEEQIKECDKFISALLAEKQKQEKIAKLLEEGNTLFLAAKWNDAKLKYNEVVGLDQNNQIAKERLVEIDKKITEEADVAAQMAKFSKLVAEGDAAVKLTKYPEAKGKYEEALSIKADPAVQTKLDNVNKKILELEEKEANEKKFQELKTQGLQLAIEQKWLDAKSTLLDAQKLKPQDAEVNKKLIEIENRIKENQALLDLERAYTDLMAAGEEKAALKDYDGAIQKFKEASQKKPAETLPKRRIEEIEALKKADSMKAEVDAKYQQRLKAGKDLMAAKEYLGAIKEFNEANVLKPEEKEPVDLAAECERLEREKSSDADKQFEKLITLSQTKLDEKDFEKARDIAERAQGFRPADPRPKELLAKILEQETIEKNYSNKMLEAERQVSDRSYERAILLFEQAKAIKPAETKPDERIADVRKLIADQASAAEKDQIYKDFMSKGALSEKAKSWDQALVNYQNALNIKPGDKPAQEKIDEIQQIIDDLSNALKDNQERQANFNKLITEADGLFSTEDYLDAKAKYEAALELIRDNSYAAKQVEECVKREKEKSLLEAEKGYRKLIDKADENFKDKEYEKARDYYTRANGMRPQDPYPIERMKEIENILNPVVVEGMKLEPLGIPYPENSVMDGYAALVKADIERKNLKDKQVEDVVSNAVEKEGQMSDIAEGHQAGVTNEIYKVTSSIEQFTIDADDSRKAVVEALRKADDESMLVDHEEAAYKYSDLLKSQEKLTSVNESNDVDYTVRDGVYRDNSEMLQSYSGALRVEMEEQSFTEYGRNISADGDLEKIEIDMEGVDLSNIERQKKNEELVEFIVFSAEQKEKILNEDKSQELLKNDAKLEVVNIAYEEKQINDSKHAPENKETLKSVEEVVQDAEKVKSDVAFERTAGNNNAMGTIVGKAEKDFADRDENRKENVELVKANDVAINEGKRERLEAENIKYLRNKNEIDNEDYKRAEITEKDEQQVAINVSGMETVSLKSTEVTGERAMSDDEQRLRARSEVEIIAAGSEEFNQNKTDKQKENVQKVDDLERTLEADFVNKEQAKQEDLLSARQKLENIDAAKPVKPRIKNSLGEEYPEGVSQESFTQNDENGLMKAIITRRVVVINGEGTVYVRTQTLTSTTYSKNDRPITEYQWNNETTGPHLQKHY